MERCFLFSFCSNLLTVVCGICLFHHVSRDCGIFFSFFFISKDLHTHTKSQYILCSCDTEYFASNFIPCTSHTENEKKTSYVVSKALVKQPHYFVTHFTQYNIEYILYTSECTVHTKIIHHTRSVYIHYTTAAKIRMQRNNVEKLKANLVLSVFCVLAWCSVGFCQCI